MRSRGVGRVLAAAAALVLALGTGGCRRKHVPVDAAPELAYPACGDAGAGEPGVRVAGARLRAGRRSPDRSATESFELRRTSCGYTLSGRDEGGLAATDYEVRYDADLTPIWAWRRTTLATSKRPDGNADTRRYELRTADVFIKRRDASGEVTLEKLLPGGRMRVPEGAHLAAVVTPGRGGMTAWLKRARLPVGGKTYDLVLDVRELVESLELGKLERGPDQVEPDYARRVRVYTYFGRDTVFADDDDVVIGDLSGLRPSEAVQGPAPAPVPTFEPPDPAHTP